MKVELIDSMGSDLTVVNAARVSFAKESKELGKRDKKLIVYLAKHGHWTPFGHCFITFRIAAPIFVARQLGKHQVGLVWNEVSRRYVDFEPTCYIPPKGWRGRAADKKQGSSDDIVYKQTVTYAHHCVESIKLYNKLLEQGVCPEQARMVLPQSMMTEWYWSGSLYAFARVCKLRCAEDTQEETREVANKIKEYLETLYPMSAKALLTPSDPNG